MSMSSNLQEQTKHTSWPDSLQVLYEDSWLIFVDKPQGLRVSPTNRKEDDSLLSKVTKYLQENDSDLKQLPVPLHRLDVHTSGVIAFAKSKDIVPRIHDAFRNNSVHKTYIALVDGIPTSQRFIVNASIVDVAEQSDNQSTKDTQSLTTGRNKRPKALKRIAVDPNKQRQSHWIGNGKLAQTHFAVLSSAIDPRINHPYALLSAKPITGRTHQIRLHLQYAQFPIVGDDCYGNEAALFKDNDDMLKHSGSRYLHDKPTRAGLKLHACEMRLKHPVTDLAIVVRSCPPFVHLLPDFGFHQIDITSLATQYLNSHTFSDHTKASLDKQSYKSHIQLAHIDNKF